MARANRSAVTVAVLGAALMLTAACSSSGGSAANDGGTPAPGSATSALRSAVGAAHGAPVKVGVVCTCSGPFGGQTSAAGKASQAWAEAVNASGGIDGHPVDLTLKDDAGSPGTAVSAATSFISGHDSVIIDLSLFDAAWAKAASDAKIPVVAGLTTDTVAQTPGFFASGQTNDSTNYSNVATAKASGAKKIGELYCVEAPQCKASVKPTTAVGAKLGTPVVYTAAISATAPNYTAECVAAKNAGVDTLIILDEFPQIIHVAGDCARQNYTPTIVVEGTGFSSQVRNATGLKDHYWASFPELPYNTNAPAVTRMNAALDKYFPGLRKDATAWSQVAVQGWTAGVAIEHALKASGLSTSAAVTANAMMSGLSSFKSETLDGWSPPLTFSGSGPHPVDCWYTARIQGGVLSLVNGRKLTCQSSQ